MKKSAIGILICVLVAPVWLTSCVQEKASAPQQKQAGQPVVARQLIVFDDVSDSTTAAAKRTEVRQAKDKFLAGLGDIRFLRVTLIRYGRGNLNSAQNTFDFTLPTPPERPQPDYDSLGPIAKTNKAWREQKEREAGDLAEQLQQRYEAGYQIAFHEFAETLLNTDDALNTKADACVNATSVRERLTSETVSGGGDTLAVIFSDGQFCDSNIPDQPLSRNTVVVLYADVSAGQEEVYHQQLERLFPKAPVIKGVQAHNTLKVLQERKVAQK
jgi:hypothetical protein